jgi:periplasmic protein TonB
MNTHLVIHADISDILYEGRNQAYGGYRLRKSSDRTMASAFAATTAVTITVLLVLFALRSQPAASLLDEKIILTELNLPPMEMPEPKQPEPPKKQATVLAAPAVKGMDTQASTHIKASNTADITTTIAPDSSFKNKQPGLATTDTGNDGPVGGHPNGKDDGCIDCKPDTGKPGNTGTDAALPQPFEVFLGDMPVPLNLDEVRKSISYPQEAKEARLEGKVSYRVLVSAQGAYVRHEVIRASNPIFDRHCARQLKALRFAPGKMGDQAFPVWVTIPFSFQLNR